MFRKFLLFFLAVLFIAGCKARSTKTPASFVADTLAPPSADELALVEASNRCAFDMYHALVNAGSPDSNVVFSPFSNFVALAMVGEGARGETADEIRKALHLSEQFSLARSALPDMLKRLEQKSQSDTVSTLIVGDGLFSDSTCPIRKDYRDWFTRLCRGEFRSVIFHNAQELQKTLDLINAWVNERTKGKIPNLLSANDLDSDVVAVLVNTLYFAGKWAHRFDEEDTQATMFHKITGDSVSVMMMKQDMKQNGLRMLETPSFQFLELPYINNRFSMLILLPREQNGMQEFDSSLNWSTWKDWTGQISAHRNLVVSIPQLKLSNRKYLIPILENMGVKQLFEPARADLNGMFECGLVYVNRVIHSINIEVDETGTVAAAATAYIISRVSSDDTEVIFTADRPYLFAIVDNENGALLFMGRIVNPVEK